MRDTVVLNAAGAIVASEGLKSVVDRNDAGALSKALGDGVARASEAIDSGAAGQLLARWAEASLTGWPSPARAESPGGTPTPRPPTT